MSPTAGRGRISPGIDDFSFLRLLETQRRDGDPAAGKYEAGITELMRGRRDIGAASRMGSPLPDRRLLRDLTTGISSAGGNLVATGLEALVAAVRPRLVLEDLGAVVLEAEGAADLTVPYWSGSLSTISWVIEGQAAPLFSGLQTKSLALSAKGAAARLAFSRKLAASSAEPIEAALLLELQRAVRSAIEGGAISGTGSSGQPLGLVAIPGIGSQPFAAATPSYSELMSMVELAGNADAELARCAWLMHPATLAALLATQISANGSEVIVSYSQGRHRIAGFAIAATRHMAEGMVLFGDFSAVRLAFFGPPQLVIDSFSNGKSLTGETECVVISYFDVGVVNPSQLVLGSP